MEESQCEDMLSSFKDDVSKSEARIRAMRTFCQHIHRFDPNVTNASDFFNGICCLDTHVTSICHEFVTGTPGVFDSQFSLDCVQAILPNNLEYYSAYTYTILALCLPLGILANLLIISTILRRNCLPKQTGYFLCSLALGDIFVILDFCAFLVYSAYSGSIDDQVHTYLMPSFKLLFASVSLLQISLISVERSIAVSRPYQYARWMAPRRAKLYTAAVWVISLFFFALALLRIPVHSNGYNNFILGLFVTVLLILPIITVVVSYAIVLQNAYRHLKNENKRLKTVTLLLKPTFSDIELKHRHRSSKFKELKISANVALLVLPFLLCWGFYTFVHLYESVFRHDITGIANWCFFITPIVLSSANPFIYLLLTRSLRKAVWTKLLAFCKRRNHQHHHVILNTTLSMDNRECGV